MLDCANYFCSVHTYGWMNTRLLDVAGRGGGELPASSWFMIRIHCELEDLFTGFVL